MEGIVMTDRELMQQALEALEAAEVTGNCSYGVTELLRTRLAQPEQEPVERECKSGGLNVYWYATHGMIQVTFE
jgi:hypothetical protein